MNAIVPKRDNLRREARQTAAGASRKADAKASGGNTALEERPDCTGQRSS
jgi:hypothetical protein